MFSMDPTFRSEVAMKDPAKACYEAYSRSFGIDIEQPTGKTTVKGPIPWEQLDATNKLRWRIVSQAGIDAERDNAVERSIGVIQSIEKKIVPEPHKAIDAPDVRKERDFEENVLAKIDEQPSGTADTSAWCATALKKIAP